MDSIQIYYDEVEEIYKFVLLASQRVHQLYRGAPPRIAMKGSEKPSVIAIREVLSGKVGYEFEESIETPDMKRSSLNISVTT